MAVLRSLFGTLVNWRLTAGITVLLLVAGTLLQFWQPRILVAIWSSRLAGTTDAEAELLLRQAAATGDEGIPFLAAALSSPRARVAATAETVLREQIGRWDSLGARGSSPKMAILAASLARYCDRYGPPARETAADLAALILRWPIDPTVIDRGRLVADCEIVLRSADNASDVTDGNQLIVAERDGSSGAGSSQAGLATQGGRYSDVSSSQLAATHALPGGGLPIQSLGDLSKAAIPAIPPEPDRRTEFSDSQPLSAAITPATSPDLAGPLRQFQADRAADDPPHQLPAAPLAAGTSEIAQGQRHDTHELSELSPEELFALLRFPEAGVSRAVEDELVGRGFSEQQIALAWWLTDPDAAVRRLWTERLSSLSGIDALPWLFWLTADEDAAVRLSAVTQLATTGDAGTLNRVHQIASADADPRVRRVAERLESIRSRRQ